MQADDAWRRHRRWAALARKRLRAVIRLRRANVGLLVVGAVLGAAATQTARLSPAWGSGLAVVGAVGLATAAFIQGRFLTADKIQERVTARSASESIKSAVVRRLSGVGQFAGDEGDKALDDAVKAVEQRAGGLVTAASLIEHDKTPLPAISCLDEYIEKRAREQANWHLRAARKRLKIEKRWRTAEIAATLLAAALSAAGAALKTQELALWVGVATTIASALLAHLAREQHAQIAASYVRTGNKIEEIIRHFDRAAPEAVAASFVDNVEKVLEEQNVSWAAQSTSAR